MRCVSLASHLRAAPCIAALGRNGRPQHPGWRVRCVGSGNNGGGGDNSGCTDSDAVSINFKGFSSKPPPQQPKATPADALQNTLAGLSANVGRVPLGTNVILDTTNDESKWRELDMQVNEYPGQRTFKAIGTGDQDFVQAMTSCVEQVVGKVHEECISQRMSAKGTYISVTLGPVCVESPDQMLQIYEKMKADGRLRFFF